MPDEDAPPPDGFTLAEKTRITRFILRNLGAFIGTQPIEAFDDIAQGIDWVHDTTRLAARPN